MDAAYSLSTPGWNAPNVAGAPSVSDSVAGTEPPTVPPADVDAHVAVAVFDGSETDVAFSVTVLPGSAPAACEM